MTRDIKHDNRGWHARDDFGSPGACWGPLRLVHPWLAALRSSLTRVEHYAIQLTGLREK